MQKYEELHGNNRVVHNVISTSIVAILLSIITEQAVLSCIMYGAIIDTSHRKMP